MKVVQSEHKLNSIILYNQEQSLKIIIHMVESIFKLDLDYDPHVNSVEHHHSNWEELDRDSFILTDSSIITDRNFEYDIATNLYATANENKASLLNEDFQSWSKTDQHDISDIMHAEDFDHSNKVVFRLIFYYLFLFEKINMNLG